MTQITRISCLIFLLAGVVLGLGTVQGRAAPSSPTANAGWVEVGAGSATGGGISSNAGASRIAALAIMPDGRPVVAWHDDSSGNNEIYVRHWNGSVWTGLPSGSAIGGGISNNEGSSENPWLAVGPAGDLYVAWQDSSSAYREIYVRHWNGSIWAEMDGSASGGGISNGSASASHPVIAVTPDGTPIVVWEDERNGDWEIYARRWNGNTWVEMGDGSASDGGISDNDSNSGIPALALDSDGNPVVAWHDDGDGDLEIYGRRWNGDAWVEIGAGSASGGGISNTDDSSGSPAVAIMGDGSPVVAWDEGFFGANIYLRRWNGSAWVEMGVESASGGGISQWWLGNVPRLAIAPDGLPIAAWHSYGNGNFEIYARRWTGQAWEEMGQGAASNGGISNTLADSFGPQLAFLPSGEAIIAWQDGQSGDDEIYVRSFPACHVLARAFSGSGQIPSTNRAYSPGCPEGQFIPGESIALLAQPAEGWRVKSWSGTANDASTAPSNSLTMPADDHTVRVTYELIPDVTHFLFVPAVLYQPVTCFPGPGEQEPNNNQLQANGPLCNGQTYSGRPINDTDHFDVFYFDIGLPSDIVATVNNHAGSGVQLALHYQAITANPLDLDFTADDGFRVGAALAAPGRYYVVLYAQTPGLPTPYTLRAEWQQRLGAGN